MTTLTTRPYAGEADLPALVELLEACEAADQLGLVTSAAALQAELCEPGFDPARDLLLWEDAGGALLAMGRLWVSPLDEQAEVIVWLYVRPRARGGDLEDRIMVWADRRAREVARERGAPARLRSHARETQTQRIALLERHGLRLARSFLRMSCRLNGPPPEVTPPEGFTIRPLAGVNEAQLWADTYNASFGDHWNAHTAGPEYMVHLIEHDPDYRADGNLVAIAPDGRAAGICYCYISPDERDDDGAVGWVETLGVRREHRRAGLGRALLLAGLRWLHTQGAASARLSVDADSPTGATRLYETCGFRRVLVNRVYLKEELL
ncbi:MAG TPA: GNAT family N-acetyltransferase [Roseiflexaceae bacterium]|nr:GNAT family N-acetyltransferase [Roseiflexaceae bacterium]